jgi:hypothetical protein
MRPRISALTLYRDSAEYPSRRLLCFSTTTLQVHGGLHMAKKPAPEAKPQDTGTDQLESLLKAYALRRLEGATGEKPAKVPKPRSKRSKPR